MKFELLNCDKRILSARGDHIVGWKYPQAFSRYGQTFDEGDFQAIQLHSTLKSGAQGFDDPALQDGFRSLEHHFAHHQQHQNRDRAQPNRSIAVAVVLSRPLRGVVLQDVIFDRYQSGST